MFRDVFSGHRVERQLTKVGQQKLHVLEIAKEKLGN